MSFHIYSILLPYEIDLQTKTVLLQSDIKNILSRAKPLHRKGIDFKLYQIPGSSKEDTQTVMTFLASMQNPAKKERKSLQDIDRLLSESLDKILLSDRVRTCSDYYRVNNKKDLESNRKMHVG